MKTVNGSMAGIDVHKKMLAVVIRRQPAEQVEYRKRTFGTMDAIKTFVVDCVLEAGGKTCPPTIVGVGVGGTADLCVHLSKVAATRPLGSRCEDPEGAKLEAELSAVVNKLGVGAQGLGGDSTAFAVHVETAATHITMNPVAVNMQCHSARRARATFTPQGVAYGF